MMDVLVLAAFD